MSFHVLIQMHVSEQLPDELIGDLTEQDVKEIIVEPYLASESLYVNGRIVGPAEIFRLRIFKTTGTLEQQELEVRLRDLRALKRWVGTAEGFKRHAVEEATDVTRDFIRRAPSASSLPTPNSTIQTESTPVADPQTIFLVHGRNSALLDSVTRFLTSLGLQVLKWEEVVNQTGEANPYIHVVLERGLESAFAVVVLFSPDDLAMLHPDLLGLSDDDNSLYGQPRPNVIYEAGLAMSKYRNRTLLVEVGKNRGISDLSGMHLVRLDNTIEKRRAFADRLRAIGCTIQDPDGTWESSGDLVVSLSPAPNLEN